MIEKLGLPDRSSRGPGDANPAARPLFPIAHEPSERFCIRVCAGEEVDVIWHNYIATYGPAMQGMRLSPSESQLFRDLGCRQQWTSMCDADGQEIDRVIEPDVRKASEMVTIRAMHLCVGGPNPLGPSLI